MRQRADISTYQKSSQEEILFRRFPFDPFFPNLLSSSMFAWHGTMLVADLSAGTVRTETLPEELLRQWLGGRGLGVHLMGEYAGLDPFDERMPVFLAAGPLCGTAAPASSRLSIVSRSPLTGTIFSASLGGTFPHKLRQAGFDAVMITGKAQDPLYLEISGGKGRLRDAVWLWGKGCIEVHKLLEDSGEVLSIGPAGERLVRMAGIVAGGTGPGCRGGLGALWGAKNLKAIVADAPAGAAPVLADAAAFQAACDEMLLLLRSSPAAADELAVYGTSALVDVFNRLRMTPTENFRKTWFSQAHLYAGPSLRKAFGLKTEACPPCPVACRRTTNCGKPIPELDALSHFGALNANPDAESLIRANILCTNMGLDPVSAAATIAACGEARGEFLVADDILDLVRKTAYREGEGDRLAEGSKRWCASIGRPELSMTVKGLELPACDPRGSAAAALAYGASTRGACLPGAFAVTPEVLHAARDFDGAAELVRAAEDNGAVVDSLAVCPLAFPAVSPDLLARLLGAAAGVSVTGEELMQTGGEIVGLERGYNARNGFTSADDILPERFFTEPGTPGDGIEVPPLDKQRYLEEMERYYRLRDEGRE